MTVLSCLGSRKGVTFELREREGSLGREGKGILDCASK